MKNATPEGDCMPSRTLSSPDKVTPLTEASAAGVGVGASALLRVSFLILFLVQQSM
jgi:hypothetical protein